MRRRGSMLCTVKDDLHDIGKNIVRSMLEAAGFEVLDLGIDIARLEEIVETAKERGHQDRRAFRRAHAGHRFDEGNGGSDQGGRHGRCEDYHRRSARSNETAMRGDRRG